MPGQNRQASERAGVGSLQSWRETDYGVQKRRTTERAARHSVFQSATHCRKLRHRTSGAGSRKQRGASRKQRKRERERSRLRPRCRKSASVLIVALRGRSLSHLAVERGARHPKSARRGRDVAAALGKRGRDRLRRHVLKPRALLRR